jgi:thiol:disulfide interchange protein DsbD
MGLLDELFGRRDSAQSQQSPSPGHAALSADEQAIGRYRYMLQTAPPHTVEQAHAEAFAKLTPDQRTLLLQRLSAELPEAERSAAHGTLRDDPQSLARLATRSEIRQPGTLERSFGGMSGRGGAMGAFFTGVLAAVVGAPCVGPFLGAALGAVMSQPAPAVVAVFLAMGFGMALPFLVLSFVPGLHRLLPKPGKWMDTLKQFFAFPMFLTAAWLLSVLADLAGAGAVGWTLAGATAIGFAVWIGRDAGLVRRGAAIAALIAAFALPAVQANVPAPRAGSEPSVPAYAEAAWSPAQVDALLAEGRPVFVDFTASWCASCQVNKLTTLDTKRVKAAFEAADVAFLVADFTQKDPVIADELKRRGRAGVPMYLWYPAGSAEPEMLPELLTQELVIGLVEGR